ncbi:MAG: drrA, partial [Frankiales bacterium]|nr:drrA [Frankiales bacterium]
MPATSSDTAPAVSVDSLVKTFGGSVRALDGVSFQIPSGTVLGLLGPNGAGKTTAVRVLTTLLRPDSGRARVAGIDVLADPEAARRVIGLAGQYAAVDEALTGAENLQLVGSLNHLPRAERKVRSRELLEQFGLSEAADR